MANPWIAGALGGLGGVAQGALMAKLLAARQGQPMTPTPEAGQVVPPQAPGQGMPGAPGAPGAMGGMPQGQPGMMPPPMGGAAGGGVPSNFLLQALMQRLQQGGGMR